MGVLRRWFHRDRARVLPGDAARIDEAITRIVTIHPRLKMGSRYRHRLAQPVATTLQFTDELVASLPAPCDASADAWSHVPCLRAFFATPDDIAQAFGRSREVRAYFDLHPDVPEVYATLGMAMIERHVLGVALEGDAIRRDVAQTTLCFTDHRLRICGQTESGLREEIAHRLIDQFAMEGLARLAADRSERLARGRELMQERVALLQRQGTGIRAVVGGDPAVESEELARVQRQIVENAESLAELRVPGDVIELELKGICDVLSKPSDHIVVNRREICIDMMNVVQERSVQSGNEIEFHFVRVPGITPPTRAFALVHFRRSELPPGGLNIDAAMRAL